MRSWWCCSSAAATAGEAADKVGNENTKSSSSFSSGASYVCRVRYDGDETVNHTVTSISETAYAGSREMTSETASWGGQTHTHESGVESASLHEVHSLTNIQLHVAAAEHLHKPAVPPKPRRKEWNDSGVSGNDVGEVSGSMTHVHDSTGHSLHNGDLWPLTTMDSYHEEC